MPASFSTMIINNLKEELKYRKIKTINQKSNLAAVLIPIIKNNDTYELIFTKRLNTLPTHAGEVSFPGGLMDLNDTSPEYTAIREAEEEIGISGKNVEILGRLDDELSIHKFKVFTYVGYVNSNSKISDLKFQENEVEKVFTVPISYFYNCNCWTENWVRRNEKVKVYFYPYDDVIIWGLTGRILSKFLKIFSKYLK